MNKYLKKALTPIHRAYLRNYCLREYEISEYTGSNKDYTNIVILGHQRTGSTLLINTLRQHPNNISFSEIFADIPMINHECIGKSPEKLNQYQKRYPIDFFKNYINRGYNDQVQTVVHKIFPPAFKKNHALLNYYKGRDDFKYLHLRRKNLLATYTSKVLAQQTGYWSSPKGSYAKEKITIDPTDCMETINLIKSDYEYMAQHFMHSSPMEIWYEDLSENFDQAIEKVQDYAGLKRQKLSPKLKKQGNADLKDTVQNYDQVIDFLNENNCNWLLG